MTRFTICSLILWVMLVRPASGNDFAGLWVGQVALNFATEVTVPLDEDNVPIAPDPNVATPTADRAYLRLLLHVNGAGQVSLLKEVAILNRVAAVTVGSGLEVVDLEGGDPAPPETRALRAESDIALVTDERLYGEFPPQPAVRIASTVLDFGDNKATEAVDAMVAKIEKAVLDNSNEANLSEALFAAVVAPIIANANVADSFDDFLRTQFTGGAVDDFLDTGVIGAAHVVAASNLVAASFFGDTRPLDVLAAVTNAAADAVVAGADPTNAAHNAASSFADVTDTYGRFLGGQLFGEMVLAASSAAADAVDAGASVSEAFRTNATVNLAVGQGILLKQTGYADARFADAIDVVLGAMETAAATATGTVGEVEAEIEQAGRDALADDVVRYAVPVTLPTPEYTNFVQSTTFLESGALAAAGAAEAVAFEIDTDPLRTRTSLADAAKLGAAKALRDVYADAARVVRASLPMVGSFGPGEGDTRLTYAIAQEDGPALGAGALTATVYLPAQHPTNPFRHRIHPDHTIGLNIRRLIRLDFDGTAGVPLATAGYGVDRITGIYREEIFGLHKPLGQDPDNHPIGLMVEGPFELNRISQVDALNAL